jgi:hypothetical protein
VEEEARGRTTMVTPTGSYCSLLMKQHDYFHRCLLQSFTSLGKEDGENVVVAIGSCRYNFGVSAKHLCVHSL